MQLLNNFSTPILFLVCLIKILSASDFGVTEMTNRIKEWQSNIVKQKVTDQKCYDQLEKWLELLKLGPLMTDNWAWRMFDATDKLNSGILTGNIFGMGQMDECLAIDEIYEGMDIQGQYCFGGLPAAVISEPKPLIQMNPYANKIIREGESPSVPGLALSICIPSACNWMEMLEEKDTAVSTCQTKDSNNEWDGGDWAFIIFMIVISIFVLTSTCYDWYLRIYKKKPVHPITLAFSFYTNGEKLLKITNNPEQLQSLNGIRAISMMWIMVGHKFNATTFIPIINIIATMNWMQSPESSYVVSAQVAVDSFLFLTGVVMAYGFMKSQCKPKARFNIILFYIHRYLRLTPAAGVLYFFFVTFYKHISSGPMWPMAIHKDIDVCLENGLSYFLYIQNIINPENRCLGHTWYLSVDMQLFIISPLILLPMVKFPKYAGYGLVALVMLSILPPLLITYFKDILVRSEDFMPYYYTQPYTRISPWLVGLLLGYLFYQLRDRKIKINWLLNLCIWSTILVGMFYIIYVGPEMTATENVTAFALYNGFHRLSWALGLMWIVFACQYGYGGIVNWILTLPIFQVWARLSYSMYLLHMIFQLMTAYRKRVPVFFDPYDMMNGTFGDIVTVTALAFFYCMMFESPVVVLEKVLLGPNGYVIKGMNYVVVKLGFGTKKQNTQNEMNETDIPDISEKQISENGKQECPV